MKTVFVSLFIALLAGGPAWGDDQVRRIQEALRKRNLYFGEVDGRKTEETTGAIRRYQQRQGLPSTGELTPPTLTSLGIVRPTKGGEEWPEGPVLKSDAPRDLAESDRRALEEFALAHPEPIAEAPLAAETPKGGCPPEPVKPPPADPAPDPAAEPAEFVRKYLAACETNRLAEEMSFYAPTVSYFDQGNRDTAFIARDVQRYYKHWPHRHYELLACKIAPVKEGEWDATFRISFRYSNDKQKAYAGKSINLFRIRQDTEGMHFTSMKEQLVRD